MSAAPASARHASATQMSGARPKPVISSPQAAAAAAMARPCLRTRLIHPLSVVTAIAPTDGAANISPTAQSALQVSGL